MPDIVTYFICDGNQNSDIGIRLFAITYNSITNDIFRIYK